MDKATFDQIVALLTPRLGSEDARRALLESALFGCHVLQQINWSGPVSASLERLAVSRFHVAVLDIQLDANDPTNRDGLRLMHDIRSIDPTIATIMLARHVEPDWYTEFFGDTDQDTTTFQVSRSPALAVPKTSSKLKHLGSYVHDVFEKQVRINWQLEIQDQTGLLRTFPDRLRFTAPKPPNEQLQEEIDELLRKLFAEWEQVEIYALSERNSGHSKTMVFQVKPAKNGDLADMTIAKLGQHELIGHEVRQYRDYIQGRVKNTRGPVIIKPASRTRTLGGIVYTFIGQDAQIRDFADFYRDTNSIRDIEKVLHTLFRETLTLQHQSTGQMRQHRDMRRYYRNKLRLKGNELIEKQRQLLEDNNTFRESNSTKFWLADGTPMFNPLSFIAKGNFNTNYYEAIIHGDLHTHNVLVDRYLDSWLIDFADTGRGPVLQDYISFEASLVVDNVECYNQDQLREWAKALYLADYIQTPTLPEHLRLVPAIYKAHQTVLKLRDLALAHERYMPEETKHAYLIGMFFTMLRLMTVLFLDPIKRFHALLAASFIAERLSKI